MPKTYKLGLIWKDCAIYFIYLLFLLVFVPSLILLVAMTGAIILTMHKTGKVENI